MTDENITRSAQKKQNTPKRILITLKDISEQGGGERVGVNLANAFVRELGANVRVVSFFRAHAKPFYALDERVELFCLCECGAKGKNPLRNLFHKSLFRLWLSYKTRKFAQNADIVLANDGWFVPFCKVRSSAKSLYIRLWHLNAPKRPKKKLALFDALVVLSSKELPLWQRYHSNVRVIPNFLPQIPAKSTDSSQKVVLSVGRMDNGDQKGFLRLLDIWKIVQEMINNPSSKDCATTASLQVSETNEAKQTTSSLRASETSVAIHKNETTKTIDCHEFDKSNFRNDTKPCHTEQSEVSPNSNDGDISLSLKAQYDKDIDCHDSADADSRNDDSTKSHTKNDKRESILDESQRVASETKQKSGLRSCERGNRTNSSLTKRTTSLPDLSLKDNALWKLIIVGDGILKPEIETKIKALNLQDSVILKPFTKEIEREYLSASIYAMSSHFEGFGMVLAEASSYALPCIAFDIATGPSDIIADNQSGFLVKDNDLQGYADKLIALMCDENLRANFGTKAKALVSERFGKDAVLKLWEELFEKG